MGLLKCVDCIELYVPDLNDAVDKIKEIGGEIVYGPFDIPIGKCAVVRDKWSNEYVILDMTKGRYVTDEDGNILDVI